MSTRHWLRIAIGAFAAVLGTVGALSSTWAANRQNQVGAFLVFPQVIASDSPVIETSITISNTGSLAHVAHVAFINGDELSATYCFECDFDVPLAPRATETLVFRRNGGVTQILRMSDGTTRSCPAQMGFVTVNLENASSVVLTDNVLVGEEVIVDYTAGTSVSYEPIAIQGIVGNGNRQFRFDDIEYSRLPRLVAGQFLTPDFSGPLNAELVLFTLAFNRQFPPFVDCAIVGSDSAGNVFSASFQFGCWTRVALKDIDPEFAYPFLGSSNDQHGGLKVDCTVAGTGPGNPVPVDGGVHGVLFQTAASGALLRRNAGAPSVSSPSSWGRPLSQSFTSGGNVTLQLESAP